MKIVAINYSLARQVVGCSTKAVLTQLGYTSLTSNGAREVGTLFHTAVARWLKGERESSVIVREFRAGYESTVAPIKDLKPQYLLHNLESILDQWLERHPHPSPFPNLHVPPEWVEIQFTHPLDTITVYGDQYLVVVVGTLDALGDDGGGLYTVETKTVGRAAEWWKDGFEGDAQNTEYAWAAEETTGREVLGTYINAIETAKLPDSNRTCYIHSWENLGGKPEAAKTRPTYADCSPLHAGMEVFLVTRNPQLTVQWKKDMLWAARRLVGLTKFVGRGIVGATQTRTQGRLGGGCNFCDYRLWCIRSARDPGMASSMMGKGGRGGGRDYRVGVFDSEEAFEGGIKQ